MCDPGDGGLRAAEYGGANGGLRAAGDGGAYGDGGAHGDGLCERRHGCDVQGHEQDNSDCKWHNNGGEAAHGGRLRDAHQGYGDDRWVNDAGSYGDHYLHVHYHDDEGFHGVRHYGEPELRDELAEPNAE